MVFIRYNETQANPNPHVNFITSLKDHGEEQAEIALRILRAMAAQVRPVMKKHGLEINSFEEYEHNEVFLGRNWNNGETVEVVLRRANGSFYTSRQLISVFCHELSHIMHMNHGPGFWKFYRLLHSEVKALQRANYYGDGFWSSGQVLRDGTQDQREEEEEDLPEYLCGGAHSQPPPKKTGPRKRRATRQTVPSGHTGAQTQKKRKAGTRIKGEGVFKGEGKSLNADEDEETCKRLGTGFRKQAGSKRAREERAAAIEARLNRMKGEKSQQPAPSNASDDDETEDEYDVVDETDFERRRMMAFSMGDTEIATLTTQARLNDFWKDSGKGKGPEKRKAVVDDLEDDEDDQSEDPTETLKRMGLSIEDYVTDSKSPTIPATQGPSQKSEPSFPLVEDVQENADGSTSNKDWVCKTCTYINEKPLGLVCELCGMLRQNE